MSTGVSVDPAPFTEVLAEMLPIGNGEAPLEVLVWYGRVGQFKRLRADYPNGARLTVHFDRQGKPSSCKASISGTIRVRAAK